MMSYSVVAVPCSVVPDATRSHARLRRNACITTTSLTPVMAYINRAVPMESEPKQTSRPNLRHYHRISTKFAACIATVETPPSDSAPLDCQLTNLSRAGVMALCNPDMIRTLLPHGASVGPRRTVRVKVQFDVPVDDIHKVQVAVECDVVYLRRVSRDTFHLGMSFVSFSENGQQYLDQYIDEKLHRH